MPRRKSLTDIARQSMSLRNRALEQGNNRRAHRINEITLRYFSNLWTVNGEQRMWLDQNRPYARSTYMGLSNK